MNKIEPGFISSVNPLKRKAPEPLTSETGKKARLDELATAAALEALAAGAPAEEITQEQILDKLEKFPEFYSTLAFEYRESMSFNLEACTRNGLCLQYMDNFYRNKNHIVEAAIKNNPRAIQYMSPYLSKGLDIVIEFLTKDPSLISIIPKKYFENISDLKPILELIGLKAFEHAPISAKKDASLVISIFQNGYKDIIKDLDPDLKKYGEFFRALLMDSEYDIAILDHAYAGFKDDEEFMLSIIDLSDEIANLTSERLKSTKDFLIKALAIADVSSFVTQPLIADQEVLEELIRYKPEVYLSFSDEKKNDTSFAISMLVKNEEVFDKLSNALKQELKQKMYVLEYFRKLKDAKNDESEYEDPVKVELLAQLGKRWFSQLDFMLEAIEIDPDNVIYATMALKKNKDFVKKIAELSPRHLYYVDQSLIESPKFMKELVMIHPDSLDYAAPSFWNEHKILKELLKHNYDLIGKFPDELRELKIFK